MAQRHLLIKAVRNMRADGVKVVGGSVLGHLITELDPHTLAGMITFRHVAIEDRGDVDDDSFPEGAELVSPDAGTMDADGDGEATDGLVPGGGTDAGTGMDADGDNSGEGEKSSSPADSVDESLKVIVDNLKESGIPENVAEALAEASQDEEVPERELLVSVDGIRQWVAKNRDLEDLPKIGRTRKAAIEKVLAG